MPAKFIGVKVDYSTVTRYFDTASGKPIGDFDHFAFVPQIPASGANQNIGFNVFAVDVYGKVLNANRPLPSTDDSGPGHTFPAANPRLQLSILNLYYEQLAVLYPIGSTLLSELRVYPKQYLGASNYVGYKAETDNVKRQKLISEDFNPSPPKNATRIF